MKRYFLPLFLALACACAQKPAQTFPEPVFEQHFTDSTLRLDYVFCGDSRHQAIYLQGMAKTGPWAGRRNRLDQVLLRGNGQVRVKDPASGAPLYVTSFSTLFQEWQDYEEARAVQKAYENCLQVPFPKDTVDIEVVLTDKHGKVSARMEHRVAPEDILIRRVQGPETHVESLWGEGPLEGAIDIVLLAEGYTAAEEGKFFADAARARDALLGHEPFASRRDAFAIRAVFAPSQDSGPSIPHQGEWHQTLVDSHFDTFYSERYLTTSAQQKVYDALGDVPFEHIIVLVNTPVYGGGGIFNNLTIMGSDHPTFNQVLVHEFGHAFGGLGDEYFYGDQEETPYPADTEPWEPNITTLKDFAAKWQDMLPEGTPVPTPEDSIETQTDVRRIWHTLSPEQKALLNSQIGVYEGAGYQAHGVYRPVQECRMKINECEEFCPVCTRAINRMIDYYTESSSKALRK